MNEQRAASAYKVTEARLRQAGHPQQAASRLRVARLAARQFESGGGFSPVTAMLGNADGPQAYLRQVGMGQALAHPGTEILAGNQANDAVTCCSSPPTRPTRARSTTSASTSATA